MEKYLPAGFRLETDRLLLRPYTVADFEDYFAYIMDAELQRMLGLRDVNDRASALRNFQWLMENRDFLALCPKAAGRAIGHIAIHPPYAAVAEWEDCRGKRGLSLSFALKASQRRQGFMLEAVQALLAYLRENGLNYVECEYADFNEASKGLQEKLGFRRWGMEQFADVTLIIDVLKFDREEIPLEMERIEL